MQEVAGRLVGSEICRQVATELVALIDGELSAERAAEVERHLAGCAGCRAEREVLAGVLGVADVWHVEEIDVAGTVMQYVEMETVANKPVASLFPIMEVEAYRAKAEAEGLNFIDLSRHTPAADAVALLSGELARRYQALPIRRDGTTLFVAMANPRNMTALDAVRMAARCMVRPMLAEPVRLRTMIDERYPEADPSEMQLLLEGMRAMQAELARMRREMAELRRQMGMVRGGIQAGAVRPEVDRRLFPFAPPGDWER